AGLRTKNQVDGRFEAELAEHPLDFVARRRIGVPTTRDAVQGIFLLESPGRAPSLGFFFAGSSCSAAAPRSTSDSSAASPSKLPNSQLAMRCMADRSTKEWKRKARAIVA